ncbi:L,D-transpeptidase [Xinfangfangia sp. CPCC 101601]|uniref:L,D-transpeptidase n=1 Tax=Pseudogemmobacter lacusdianii TaxID=3069608 RepID=A0ABU0VYV3_9RHOB|nr:L,D-transpeptidase [Xinfangfangia sp. CPCC 101601]MDQ2066899.1 L,D-transpeptidase [Xinfangfangia sp. CPCC 101601]
MNSFALRLAALFVLPVLAACGPRTTQEAPPTSVAGYEAVQDGEYLIPAVDPRYLIEGNVKTVVPYTADDPANSIVVDTYARKLYWVHGDGTATRYGIAVGREGINFRGNGYLGRKAQWPSWTPTQNMIRTQPDMYAQYAGGLPGGLENPLGARALYLYRGGRDTMFRIHGTIDNASVGRATSAGCIRLFNQDAIDLFEKASNGTKVKVRTEAESLAIEGPYMDDAFGRVVPATPENERKRAEDEAKIAAKFESDRVAAEAAKEKHLRKCRRQGILEEDCPALELEEIVLAGEASDVAG